MLYSKTINQLTFFHPRDEVRAPIPQKREVLVEEQATFGKRENRFTSRSHLVYIILMSCTYPYCECFPHPPKVVNTLRIC